MSYNVSRERISQPSRFISGRVQDHPREGKMEKSTERERGGAHGVGFPALIANRASNLKKKKRGQRNEKKER